jgi:hypothetical protein
MAVPRHDAARFDRELAEAKLAAAAGILRISRSSPPVPA